MTTRDLDLTDVVTTAASGCGCCSTGDTASPTGPARDTTDVVTTYGVAVMTCGHCVGALTGELSALGSVRDVQIALVAGGASSVTVTSSAPLDDQSVRTAVDEAGCKVTGRLG